MRTLDDAVVIATGRANGLGPTYCEALGHEGARVVIATD
jgi:NAD(P)-dependent dehydrogenase (short-subunit alcohol dehydrogenase family)